MALCQPEGEYHPLPPLLRLLLLVLLPLLFLLLLYHKASIYEALGVIPRT